MHLPSLNSWQSDNIGLFSLGIIEAESCQQRQIARQVVCGEQVESAMRRLRRFLNNDALDQTQFVAEWTRWIMRAQVSNEVRLLVDETKLRDDLGVMMVGLAWENRCIPLAWRVYVANSAADYPAAGQVAMIVDLLKQVKMGIPDDVSVLVMADRGIGTSPRLCGAVDQLGWHYLFRVTCQSKIVTASGDYTIAATVEAGEIWGAEGQVFKQRGRIPAHARAIWADGYDEPWALVTNDPALTGYEYAIRNWQEQSFRDLKSYGWQWEDSCVTDPAHMSRLLILLTVAYGWVLSLGAYFVHHNRARSLHRRANGQLRRQWSLFKEGLTCFTEYVKRHAVCLKLCFVPDKRLA